jgi:hypothetical protein
MARLQMRSEKYAESKRRLSSIRALCCQTDDRPSTFVDEDFVNEVCVTKDIRRAGLRHDRNMRLGNIKKRSPRNAATLITASPTQFGARTTMRLMLRYLSKNYNSRQDAAPQARCLRS